MDTLEQIVVRVKSIAPSDSIGKAAEAIRCSTVGAVPVVESGRLLGILTAETVADFLAAVPPRGARELSIESLPLDGAMAFPQGMAPAETLQFLRATRMERAVVLDITGDLLGFVTRAELVSAVCGRVRPPLIGGMATPFGVYLTGGGVRGGVGDLALMATGVYLAFLQVIAAAAAEMLVGHNGWIYSLPAPVEWHNWISRLGAEPPFYVLFALMFRMSGFVTGYHAAEHQVVHTIEAGDDLRPEVVRQKSRVHPRCGTNVVAAILIMAMFWRNRSPQADEWMLLIGVMTTLFLGRRVGGVIQQYVTTCPATPRQIQSGITAGQELIDRFQHRPHRRVKLGQRIWNMGIIQVMSGSFLVIGILLLIQELGVPLPPGF
jgi:CBS domain-containing protein